ncbi:MAG TPA: type II CAAX endopeptidase family protein, partial [Puia sp.]|nr:type II CAAX endopeptidase family protein [Puia sp.]
MSNNIKIPSPWAQLGLFLRLIGFALIGLVALALLFGQLPQPLSSNNLKLAQVANSILLFGVPAYFYARLTFPDRPFFYLGFRPAVKGNFYLLAILLLLFSFPLEGWLGILNKHIPLPHWMVQTEESIDHQLTTLLQVKNPFDVVINLLVIAVIPGIFEEMCFRGVVQRIMIRLTKSPWAGIVVTGFIFSFMHFEFQGFLPRMFLGVLLGAAYHYSGSLWTCVLAHCFFNGIQVLAFTWYPTVMNNDNPSVPAYSVLISSIIVVILLVVMRRQSNQ